MKKIFLMLALVMGLSVTSGCHKESNEWYEVTPEATASLWEAEDYELEELKRKHGDHECDFTEYVDYDGSTWECYDAYCEYKKIGRHAPKSTAQKFYDDISGESDLSRVYSDDETQAGTVAETKGKRGVYTTSELLYSNDDDVVTETWKPDTSYRVRVYLGPDADDSIMRDQRMTVNVFYPGYVMNGRIGTILVEVSTDEEIFVGSTSFVAEGSLNLVHGISHASTVTVSLEYFDGKIWLEFYTGATREHYENRPADHSGTFTGPTTISFTFTRDMKTIPQGPMKPEPEQPESTDEDTPSLPDTPESQTSTERAKLYPGPEVRPEKRAEDTEMDTEVETEEAEVGGEAEVDTEETMSQAQRNDLCFFPSQCYSGNHIAMCDVAMDDYLRATGSTICECPRRNSGIHRSRCPYNHFH